MTAIDIANAQQRAAANPAVSAFVAASAGSGKTKLLTDRLLRLMLGGARPEKILCLTYTKAAAAEMRIRLNGKLGLWVVAPREKLAAELRGIDVTPDETTLLRARKLFADVLDLPGGMRIETIHAFCQSLLRRFPLEAELSPHFQVADDESFGQRLREAREQALSAPQSAAAIAVLAAEIDEKSFAALSQEFCQAAELAQLEQNPAALAAMQRAALAANEESEAEILAAAVRLPREAQLRTAILRIAAQGTPKDGQGKAGTWLNWLSQHEPERMIFWEEWAGFFFTTSGTPRDIARLCGKNLRDEAAWIEAAIDQERTRILALQDRLKTARLAALNAALIELLLPIATAERGAKTLAAELSYSDLIARTGQLLIDPGAAWVLYKLDGGIEHLLLDEVQDTAPGQWEIANAIAGEFFAGAGAQDGPRSIFAVGDPKQSIFSFQGADLTSFSAYRDKFKAQAVGAGQAWLDGELSVSFRSSAPVLGLTDAVFTEGFAREGVYEPGRMPAHVVSRNGQAGRVTLWPLTRAQDATDLPIWAVPDDYERGENAQAQLAKKIADYIETRLQAPLPSRNRLARPGDFLILVRRRNALVGAITAALKGRGINVAGLDRMVLTSQTAVADLLALCDALLLPDDDRAVAHFLASPLGGLGDDSLMHLALGRTRSLVGTLYARAEERPDWLAAKNVFEALRQKADFLTPFALLSETLGPLGGRARLLRRLGPEAAEPLDEFLAEALNFTQSEPGSLQNFVHAMRLSGASIKREAEAEGDDVRIMTVHGAKGLQAPIVILPDTTSLPQADKKLFWLNVPQQPQRVPVFCPRTNLRNAVLAQAAATSRAEACAEYNRLLYVALTRAEDELLICGAAPGKNLPEQCWYQAVAAGFTRLPRRDEDGVLVHECGQSAAPDRESRIASRQNATLPGWAGGAPDWVCAAPATELTRPERIVPSRAVEDAPRRALPASPLGRGLADSRMARAAAMARGSIIHALLQHLPGLPQAARPQAAQTYLAAQGGGIAAEAADISRAVLAILDNPALAPLYGPGSQAEVPLAGVVNGRELGGIADRLAITPAEIWLADYKSDRTPPAAPEAIPGNYLAQLSAYGAVLRAIYPGRRLRALLIWTETATAMQVPDTLLAQAPDTLLAQSGGA